MIDVFHGFFNFSLVSPFYSVEKVISGDDDLPKRDDIGERRRKHELRVLAGATVKSEDDHGGEYDMLEEDDEGNGGISGDEDGDTEDTEESEDEFYKQVKQQRAAKLAAKAEIYTRYVPPLHF